jgi:hypothetical protein
MLGRFQEGFDSWRRILAGGADLQKRAVLFINCAAEVGGFVARGLDASAAADALADLAQAHGLLAHFGADGLEKIISEAFDNAEVVPDLEPAVEEPQHRGNGQDRAPLRVFLLDREPEGGAVEVEWLIENLLPRRGVVILSGWPGVGKTHILNDLMCSVVTGMPFAGHEVRRTCGAVLFAAEGADSAHSRWGVLRYAKVGPWFDSMGLPVDTAFPAAYTDQVPRLNDPDALAQYDAALAEIKRVQAEHMAAAGRPYDGLGLVGVDTFNAAVSFADEQHNKVGPNQAIFNFAHALARKHDCCFVMVDHLGKDQAKGPLGTIAKSASCDVDLRITGTVGEDGSVSHTAMTIHKLRAGAQGRRLPFELKALRAVGAPEGITVRWDCGGDGMHVSRQNKRHGLLMRALDEAILEKYQWVRLGDNANYKAVDSRLVRTKFELSHPATAEEGKKRDQTIKRAFNRALRDSSEGGLIASKTLADKSVVIWRTDYKIGDSLRSAEVSQEQTVPGQQ